MWRSITHTRTLGREGTAGGQVEGHEHVWPPVKLQQWEEENKPPPTSPWSSNTAEEIRTAWRTSQWWDNFIHGPVKSQAWHENFPMLKQCLFALINRKFHTQIWQSVCTQILPKNADLNVELTVRTLVLLIQIISVTISLKLRFTEDVTA